MDVVICNLPTMLPWWVPAAPAVLSGACHHLNLTSRFLDFNVNFLKGDTSISDWADQVLILSPKVVAISLFSYKAQSSAIELGKQIKAKSPTTKIIIGGSGLKDGMNGPIQHEIQENIDTGVFDHYIVGNGEYLFLKFLAVEFNIDQPDLFDTLDAPYLPNFDDYDFKFYSSLPKKKNYPIFIPVTGSQGCVRNCTFCEVPGKWAFSQRQPIHIANEIRNTLKTVSDYNVHFHFTDSLVNGSLPAFEEMLDLFLEIKKEYPNFNWGGQFIIRRAKQSGDDYWKKIADTGGRFFNIGIETGSDRLRSEMKKHFSTDDLRHSVRMMHKYGVNSIFLLFTGMPTETEEDFQATLDLLTEMVPYKDSVILEVELGWITTIHYDTPLRESSLKDKDMIVTKDPVLWYNKNNPTLTFRERISRRIRIQEHATKCGYQLTWDSHLQVEDAERIYREKEKIIDIIENKS